MSDLNKKTVLILAMKHYDNPKCLVSEFKEDLNRIKAIKKNIGKYILRGELNERLILNHFIIYANVFGVEFSVKLIFFFLKKNYLPVAKTFLLYLGYLPEKICGINGKDIITSDIPIDANVANALRNL